MINHRSGVLAWLATNKVVANLLMFLLLVGGLYYSTKIKKEVYPRFELDQITISVGYPGASPQEVEQGILLAIEEEVRAVVGVHKIISTASEGSASLQVELQQDVNKQEVYQNIQQAVSSISTLPTDIEVPRVSLAAYKPQVLALNIFGNVSQWNLRILAEQVRDKLLQNPNISVVEVRGSNLFEVQVELKRGTLEKYQLTLGQVAKKIADTSVELPAGSIKTTSGEILLRVSERSQWADEFSKIPIISSTTGGSVLLGDICGCPG